MVEVLKKSAFVAAAAAAGLMMIGSPAFADGEINHVNVLGAQVADVLNSLGVPLLSPEAETDAAATDVCVAESED